MQEAYEGEYWCKRFNCTPAELRAAVEEVGVTAEDVEQALNRK